jgi:Na+-translocating ferredoxin:NAD+ oxidoreductase subunit G
MADENRLKSPLCLLPALLIALFGGIMILLAHSLTSERIELNEQLKTIELIESVMPLTYDNNLYDDRQEVAELSTTVYRARQNTANVGLVFMPVTTAGYKDEIKMAIGISYDGEICAVRIIEQHETEGLGDAIDQSNSDWIRNFDGRSLLNTAENAWAVHSDMGEFDQLSGATISARSVINAVKNTLDFYQINRDSLYN